MIDLIYQIIRTSRPRQWLKNLSLVAAATFSGRLFLPDAFVPLIYAFVAFCFLSSGAYFLNDLVDYEKDKRHPVKKNRPIASGKIPFTLAWSIFFIYVFIAFYLGVTFVGSFFTYAVVLYILIQVIYSFYLRNIIILDSLTVATGFVIRVFAGGFASSSSLSSWLVLATIGLSMLMAFGKRRSEKTILKKHLIEGEESKIRGTLRHYPDSLLDSMISTSSSLCIITYSLFAFQISTQELSTTLKGILPSILSSPKWMMLTIPLVIYGVARYLYVIYEKEDAESPERVLLSDRPLLFTVALWGSTVLGILYFLPVFL